MFLHLGRPRGFTNWKIKDGDSHSNMTHGSTFMTMQDLAGQICTLQPLCLNIDDRLLAY